MSVLQAIIIALFVYLASIGSIVGNTLGWYTLGRPLVASFVVGIVMNNVELAIMLGLMLQLANLGSVTPGGAVGWDLSYATYIGVALALTFHQGDLVATTGIMWAFSTVGGAIGVAMWNLSYALNLSINRLTHQAALQADGKQIALANAGLGNFIGFVCRFVPAIIILYTTGVVGSETGFNIVNILPSWVFITLSTFGGMMASLGIGVLLSMLIKEKWQFVLFLFGFMLVGYLQLPMMAVALFSIVITVVYYVSDQKQSVMSMSDGEDL